MSTGLRNAVIVLLLAAAVFALPGGQTSAQFITGLFSTLIIAAIVFAVSRMYREHRVAIYGLGDKDRGMAYGALGAIVLAVAGVGRLLREGGPGVLLWIALIGGAIFALVQVYRNYKAYNF